MKAIEKLNQLSDKDLQLVKGGAVEGDDGGIRLFGNDNNRKRKCRCNGSGENNNEARKCEYSDGSNCILTIQPGGPAIIL